jgi:hypothetical protein
MSDDARRLARDLFFFEPVPGVRRVIFMATPHGGGSWPTTVAGAVATRIVRRSGDAKRLIEEIDRDNPGAVRPAIRDLPTSIDALMARSPYLEAVRRLPINPSTTIHTIAGHGYCPPELSRGDLVVPLESAHIEGAASEHWVRAVHNTIYRTPDAIDEVRRILAEHVASGLPVGPGGDGLVVEDRQQGPDVDRLDEVVVDARGARAGPIALLAVAGDGDEDEALPVRPAPQPGRHLEAVHPGQADVEQDHAGPEGVDEFEGGRPVVSGMHLVPEPGEHPGDAQVGVDVVVDDDDPPGP